jgi:DMSO/TMAO reductase YedYZ molybdopterin-dependent catalytic subunit
MTPNEAWYVVSLKGAYEADLANYRLTVGGKVETPLRLSIAELRARFEEVVLPITLACVGNVPNGRLMSSGYFRGVRTRDLMQAVGVEREATGAAITALEGYLSMRDMPLMRRPDTLLAYEMGPSPDRTEPLGVEHGFPLRILTPGIYGWVQPKWVSSIIFVDDGHHYDVLRRSSDFVESKMQLASGFSYPRDGDRVAVGPRDVLGFAFGDGRLIDRVEVQVDQGPWQPAEIVWNDRDDALPTSVWVLWRYPWQAQRGVHKLAVRATYQDGDTQITGRAFPYSGGSLSVIGVEAV